MRPTSLSMLVVAALAAAAVGWLLLSVFYAQMPRLPWLPIIVLTALAIAEAILAQNTAARIQHKPGAPRVDPLAVARYAVLAKASSLALVGAALWLERSCRVPERPDQKDGGESGRTAGRSDRP